MVNAAINRRHYKENAVRILQIATDKGEVAAIRTLTEFQIRVMFSRKMGGVCHQCSGVTFAY
jgi:hypothetical protein